jgi:glycerol kinase
VILAIDQGTTGTACLLVDENLRPVGRGYREIRQYFPQPGWVEHDPEEIWASVLTAAADALASADASPSELTAVGIANQRETTVVWERRSGRPVHRAIVWQDRRTAERCRQLPHNLIRERTGLVPDPYFSSTKLEWILNQPAIHPDEVAFGTVDSWLVWNLTRGQVHVTDLTNASRTMMLNLQTLAWDDELLSIFGVSRAVLPRIVGSSEIVGTTDLFGRTLPVAGIAGDQQASLFGHGCFFAGEAKATYGTGTFVLINVGSDAAPAPDGLLKTAAAVPPGAEPQYVVEGAVLASGAVVQWLRDSLHLVLSAHDAEEIARSVDSSEGVVFVPALNGLGSPWWDPEARGLITGLTRGTTPAHLVRATLEGIAFQVADVVEAWPAKIRLLRADGGASANTFLMQFQADLLGCPVEVAAEAETTALGAAALAGLALGTWSDLADLQRHLGRGLRYEGRMTLEEIARKRADWQLALRRARLR